jgi:hypothetical protein
MRACAEMLALGEGDVIVGCPSEVKGAGILELRFIAVAGGNHSATRSPSRIRLPPSSVSLVATRAKRVTGPAHRKISSTAVGTGKGPCSKRPVQFVLTCLSSFRVHVWTHPKVDQLSTGVDNIGDVAADRLHPWAKKKSKLPVIRPNASYISGGRRGLRCRLVRLPSAPQTSAWNFFMAGPTPFVR